MPISCFSNSIQDRRHSWQKIKRAAKSYLEPTRWRRTASIRRVDGEFSSAISTAVFIAARARRRRSIIAHVYAKKRRARGAAALHRPAPRDTVCSPSNIVLALRARLGRTRGPRIISNVLRLSPGDGVVSLGQGIGAGLAVGLDGTAVWCDSVVPRRRISPGRHARSFESAAARSPWHGFCLH